jgi:hypothetical protein
MLVGALAIIAGSTVILSTRWGIGLSADSVVYVGVARSVINGDGVVFLNDIGEPAAVIHFPPIYPWLLAGTGMFGVDPLLGARWVNAAFFVSDVLLIGFVVYLATASYGASIIAAFLICSSFPMVQIHSMAWSEPTFIFFGFSGFSLLYLFLKSGKRSMLYLSCLAIGLSCLSRYAGIGYVLSGAVAILFLSTGESRKRLADVAGFVGLSSLPLAIWVIRNSSVAGSAFNRSVAFHPPGAADFMTAIESVGLWLFPVGLSGDTGWVRLLTLMIVLVFASIIGFLNSRQKLRYDSKFCQLAGFFLLGYGLFIISARTMGDAAIKFDTRILSPAYVAAMMLVLPPNTDWFEQTRSKANSWARFAFDSGVITFLVMQMTGGVAWFSYSYSEGIGYASKKWRESQLIKLARAVDPTTAVFTNAPDFVYMFTNRQAAMIPRKVNPDTRLPNNRYFMDIAMMQRELKENAGVVLYFSTESRLWYLPSGEELQKDAALRLVAGGHDGNVYIFE